MRQRLYRVAYGDRVRHIPEAQRPYVLRLLRWYHQFRWVHRLRSRPVLSAEAYRARVRAAENEEFLSCLLCGESRVQPIFRVRRYGKKPGARGRRQQVLRYSYRVVRCPSCHFFYRNPNVRPERVPELYTRGDYSNFLTGGYARNRQAKYRQTMRAFNSVFDDGTGRRILDFGCGTGLFLELADAAGFATYGIDFAADSLEHARRRVPAAKLFSGDPADNPEVAAGGFDVITMWSVLAHLARPVDQIRELRSLLAHDGVLVAQTVNIGSLIVPYKRSRWGGFTANHLVFFSADTATRLFTAAGFAGVSFAPFYTATSQLGARELRQYRRHVQSRYGGSMLQVMAFATDDAVRRWAGNLDVHRAPSAGSAGPRQGIRAFLPTNVNRGRG